MSRIIAMMLYLLVQDVFLRHSSFLKTGLVYPFWSLFTGRKDWCLCSGDATEVWKGLGHRRLVSTHSSLQICLCLIQLVWRIFIPLANKYFSKASIWYRFTNAHNMFFGVVTLKISLMPWRYLNACITLEQWNISEWVKEVRKTSILAGSIGMGTTASPQSSARLSLLVSKGR